MLTTLTVQDLVVVRTADIEFGPGLTVLTGETGAGKSILVGALGLALGERAESRMIRAGCERATVTAAFDISNAPAVRALLETHGLLSDDECILRRVVARDGRSRAFCNASPVAAQLLREIGAALVDVHAQHAGQQLLRRDVQRRLLDEYGDLQAAVAGVANAHGAWKAACEELAVIERAGTERDRIELLRYQAEELAAARIGEGEAENIEEEFRQLAGGAENIEHCAALIQLLNSEDGGVIDALGDAAGRARELAHAAPRAAQLPDLIEQAAVLVREAVDELDRLATSLEADPERLAQLDTRLAELHALARKHHVPVTQLPELIARLAADLAAWDARDASTAALRERIAETRSAYDEAAAALSVARGATAKRMNTDITKRMRDLGIPEATFEVAVETTADGPPQAHGADRIEFRVSTNAGQPCGPLNKVASGGELSRVGLAIQAATARHAGVPVVVYDEVDTGIGGTTATIVGRNLRAVAAHCQVICITHSPQVASAGDAHLQVSKTRRGRQAETVITALGQAERETEISRMLGAAEATASSVAHARDLIATASQGG